MGVLPAIERLSDEDSRLVARVPVTNAQTVSVQESAAPPAKAAPAKAKGKAAPKYSEPKAKWAASPNPTPKGKAKKKIQKKPAASNKPDENDGASDVELKKASRDYVDDEELLGDDAGDFDQPMEPAPKKIKAVGGSQKKRAAADPDASSKPAKSMKKPAAATKKDSGPMFSCGHHFMHMSCSPAI